MFQNKLVNGSHQTSYKSVNQISEKQNYDATDYKAKKSVLVWSWYLTTHCNHSQTAPERSCFAIKSCTQTEAIISMFKHPLICHVKSLPSLYSWRKQCCCCGMNYGTMLITHRYFGEVRAPAQWDVKKTNISEEAFVTQSWMEMAWSHSTTLNSDRTGRLCDPKWTHIYEEVDKSMDKCLLHIFGMFLVVHQYQYDTILIAHKKCSTTQLQKETFHFYWTAICFDITGIS